MMRSRREMIALFAGLSIVSLSGCSSLDSESDPLTLEFINADSNERIVNVRFYRVDADDYHDALVLSKRYVLSPPPDGEHAYAKTEEELLDSEKYFVDVHLQSAPSVSDTYHFYPALQGDERTDRLFIEVRTDPASDTPYFNFDQNH